MSATIDPAVAAELLAREIRGEFPDARGRFGPFGGRYVPETLIPALDRLEAGIRRWLKDPDYQADLARELNTWVGRPTPLSHATTLSARWGADIWMKREDLAHTGAHKINSAIGQALLAKRLGAKRVVAETGAGQHGVASAAACARLGLPVTVYMGAVDIERQAPNVGRMKLMGATVKPVTSGDQTLRAAVDEALRDWVSDPNGTYYLLGSAIGPHPYPYLVRELQAIIGRESRWPAWAADPTRSACSIRSSPTARSRSTASKPAAAVPGSVTTRRPSPTVRPASCRERTACCCTTRMARSRKPIPCRPVSITRVWDPSTRS